MIIVDLIMIFSILSVGLFTGLMMTLVVILQKQWNKLSASDYINYFKGFLLIAKGNSVISILTFSSFLLPIFTGTYYLSNNHLNGFLIMSAGIVFFLSCFVVTIKFNLPIYNKVIGWDIHVNVTECEKIRNKFYLLNIIRMSGSLLSFILLVIGHI